MSVFEHDPLRESIREALAGFLTTRACELNLALTTEAHAAPFIYLCQQLEVTPETVSKMEREGRGPITFKVGHRRLCRIKDWNAWLDLMAEKAKAEANALAAEEAATKDRLAEIEAKKDAKATA